MSVFKDTHFLVIEDAPEDLAHPEDDLHGVTIEEIQTLIVENGGLFDTRPRLACNGAIEELKINHIITNTTHFADYARAAELMVSMTNPDWLVESAESAQKKNYRLYCPKPAPFMDKVMLCVADNIAQGDKEIMHAGVRAFGGQYLDALSRYTTHLVAVDLTSNKSVVAATIKRKHDFDVKIVLPHWVDECMRKQRHVDEQPFLLMNPKVLFSGKPDFSVQSVNGIQRELDSPTAKRSSVLKGKRVYLAGDYHLSEHLRRSVHSLVESSGGIVQEDFDANEINVYIGKYRLDSQFQTCFLNDRIDVGSLMWLYYIIMHDRYVLPLDSNLLHFPVPEEEITQFKNMRISITGISGDARHYLSKLIVAMGGTFTRTLDRENDFLVCALKSGEKYNAVNVRWPDVKIVNHLWVEESYAKWQFMDPKLPRYSSVGALTQLLGKARVSKAGIDSKWHIEGDKPLHISDSADEEEDKDLDGTVTSTPATHNPVSSILSFNTADNTQGSGQTCALVSSPRDRIVVDVTGVSPSSMEHVRAGRSAKAKASLKLHSDMEDLNQYTSMSKSSRKMRTFMEELERTATPSKKKRDVAEGTDEGSHRPQAKKAKVGNEVHLVAILTGCEQILTLNKADMNKLLKLGIQIVSDYSVQKPIDTIIAPKVLRTEKFLKSLSKAKRIIHPSFLSDILKCHFVANLTWPELIKEFNIEHYSLDKVVPVKQINDDLGITGKTSGLQRLLSQDIAPVFSGHSLNLSLNLNGGPYLISSILIEHGLSASKIVKVTAGTRKSGLLTMDGTTILVAHKSKDQKAASKIAGVTMVEWEWCVRSIFHKKVQSYKNYII